MIADIKQFLGHGLYTVAEAALYARINKSTLARWIFGDARSRSVITPEIDAGEKLVSFLDFVQALAVRNIRVQKNVPLQKIREAMRFAEKTWGMKYPFAMRHTTYLWGDNIVISPPNARDDAIRQYVEASGAHKGSVLLTPIVELYLEDLDFADSKKGVAVGCNIFRWSNTVIKMNPHQRFGEPLLPSGYSVRAIWDAVEVEGGVTEAAQAYDIPREEVQVALRFLDHLSGNAA